MNDAVYYTNDAIAKICLSVLPDKDTAQFAFLSALKESRNKAYDGWSVFVYGLFKHTAQLELLEPQWLRDAVIRSIQSNPYERIT